MSPLTKARRARSLPPSKGVVSKEKSNVKSFMRHDAWFGRTTILTGRLIMRKACFILTLLMVAFFVLSCNRKEKEEELNILNAPEKYGGVMGKTLKKTKAMDSLLYLKNKITTFQVQEGRYPSSLNELVEKKYIEKLPEPPEGLQFAYEPLSGKVDVK